ncbi:SemiSWEET transporter [Polynucleobacter necessarius]|uniref:SemiSWEET transporter n=1 Tax=Polynucleobacter necessarius TaxID=576610 RepID=UPI002F9309F6
MALAQSSIDVIGYCAAFLTTVSFLPQAIQSWRTRDLSGISLGMYSLFTLGVGLWLIYGLIIEKWPLILEYTHVCIGLEYPAIKSAPY